MTLSQGDASLREREGRTATLWGQGSPLRSARCCGRGPRKGLLWSPGVGLGAAEHQGAPPTAAGGVATGGGGRGGGDRAGHCSVDSFSKRGIFLFFCF